MCGAVRARRITRAYLDGLLFRITPRPPRASADRTAILPSTRWLASARRGSQGEPQCARYRIGCSPDSSVIPVVIDEQGRDRRDFFFPSGTNCRPAIGEAVGCLRSRGLITQGQGVESGLTDRSLLVPVSGHPRRERNLRVYDL